MSIILGVIIFFIVVVILYSIYTNANVVVDKPVNNIPIIPVPPNTPIKVEPPSVDPDSLCTLVPTCEKIDQVDMNNWNVQCKGQLDNVLHKNSSTEYLWMKGFDDATFAKYTNPLDAVKAACPPFGEPACNDIASCTSVKQLDKQNWAVQCKGQMDNTLHMNSPTNWIWNKAYNDATFANHTSAYNAIKAACPPFDVPSCTGIDTCTNVTQATNKDWNVQCMGQMDNTLHMNSPNEWVWSKGYNDATFSKHPTATAAIRAACPTFGAPVCTGIASCNSVTQTGTKDWLVKCKGQTDNTLHMNSPTEWVWMQGYNAATFAKHPSATAAINAACPAFDSATDPGVCSPTLNNCAATMPVNIAGYGANQTAIKCVGDTDYTNTLMGSPGRWLYYKGYNTATFDKYIDVPSAILAYCNSTPRRAPYN